MIFHSLQRRIVVVFVGLLTVVMTLILALVSGSNERIVDSETQRELATGKRVFTLLIEQNQRQLEMAAGVLAADFGFREAIATQDQQTVRSVISNHGLRIGAQVMMVISPDGHLIANTQRQTAASNSFPFPDLLSAAESAGKSSGFRQMEGGQLFQFVLVPVQAPKLIAWVAMGFLVNDAWAHDLSVVTGGLELSVIRHDATDASILASSFGDAQRAALQQVLNAMPKAIPQSLTIGAGHYQAVQLPLGKEMSAVLLRSVEQVEAPFRALQRVLWTIVLAGAAVFAVGSLMLARRIVRPLNELSAAARHIEAGHYDEPISTLPDDEIGHLALSFDRMREQVSSREQRIRKLAYEDQLTGLPNRTRFLEAFDQLPGNSQGAVALLNLDRFALINSALGHPIGDRLLGEIGPRFQRILSGADLVARLWGDEFAFLLPGADQAAAANFAGTVLAALRHPVTIEGQRLDVSGSVGIALYPRDGLDGATLLRRAESAMHAAKKRNNSVAFADETGGDPPHEQLSLIGEMREAMQRQEFLLYYQPKLDLASGKITGAEALIRWRHPKLGLVPPSRFIPFAEQTGFIREMTPWILESVCAQTAKWRKAGLFIVPSVNFSARDMLDPGLVDFISKLIAAHDLPADALCIEITESALMDDPELALSHLHRLAALGFKLSIDDYGIGQASLAYLKTLPVHELKIDQTFVRAISDSPKNGAIVRSTIMLCHELGLKVVAEGAETSDDLDWLIGNDCDTAQGYVIARPMPADELHGWITAYAGQR
jgi:diguanylate cyclase (GGDEF)-like protein